MKFISFLVFIPLQILFLPLAVFGALLVSYRRMVVSKRLGVSGTASSVIEGRWMLHVFGIREDPASVKLAGALPNTSPLGMWLFLFPLWVKQKIAGSQFGYARVRESGAEPMLDFLTARTLYFDQILRRAAKDVEQFVVMGAGYDARSYGELAKRGLACFEVDQAPTQELKIASLAKAGVDASRVTFVEVDFGQEGAFEQLRRNGYDPSRKMFVGPYAMFAPMLLRVACSPSTSTQTGFWRLARGR